MQENKKNVQKVVDMLNTMMNDDKIALNSLLKFRVPCNETFANRPDINVRQEDDGSFTVSCLGLINAIIGHRPDGWGHITAYLNEDTSTFDSFSVTKRNDE